MFRIGEFAQIAQVSSRQLRFYDQLGILQPAHTDSFTGYRYYSIRQLPRLNRILALKEIGLSLEQISPLLKDGITPSELRGLLTKRREQVQDNLREEEIRLRYIESRIAFIDKSGSVDGFDVVTKSVEPLPYMSTRCPCSGMDDALRMVRTIAAEGEKVIQASLRDKLIVLARNEPDVEELDLEIGYSLTRSGGSAPVRENTLLRRTELPGVDIMATLTREGTNEQSHASFGALGAWIEANNYEIAGPCREVFLEPVSGHTSLEKVLVEIQFPVRPMASA
jgi:DNA-binding transcriptional MerR regulator/effector-binding domain-containing protein